VHMKWSRPRLLVYKLNRLYGVLLYLIVGLYTV
jgi:hypothetical protein